MYLEFYALREFPFSNTSEERFLYKSPALARVLSRTLYTVRARRGMALVTGEPGTGKTFLANVVVARLGHGCKVLFIPHPLDTSKQLLRTVARLLGLDPAPAADKLTVLETVEHELLRLHRRGRLVALVLDEAQALGDEALEEIRLLWNMEQDGKRLIQTILFGQAELRERLAGPQWRSLAQRIVQNHALGALGPSETQAYVLHRRRVAKREDEPCPLRFTENALTAIHEHTKGVPRLINVLCDSALMVGFFRRKHVVDSSIVEEAARERSNWDVRIRQMPAEGGVAGARKPRWFSHPA